MVPTLVFLCVLCGAAAFAFGYFNWRILRDVQDVLVQNRRLRQTVRLMFQSNERLHCKLREERERNKKL